MSGTTQANIAIATPAFAKRRARALIGWLTEEEGTLWLAGRNAAGAADAILVARCQAARTAVSKRPPHIDSSDVVSPLAAALDSHLAAFRASPWGSQLIMESGEPALVDLRQIRSFQPLVHIEDARKRVAGISPGDWNAIAELSIPVPPVVNGGLKARHIGDGSRI